MFNKNYPFKKKSDIFPHESYLKKGLMFGKFLPRETSFFDFFEQHAAVTVEAAEELQKIVSANNHLNIGDIQRFKNWEHQGDAVLHECIEALHKTFITPLVREDILDLISGMDDILDNIDACFDCIVIYRIQQTTPELEVFARILYEATVKISRIVKNLRNMDNAAQIRNDCQAIRILEGEADTTLRKAIGKLFDEEKDTRLVIKFKEIYEILEDAIDSCHKVANITEGIILECD